MTHTNRTGYRTDAAYLRSQELIPEFFTLPVEFLENSEQLPLGVRQARAPTSTHEHPRGTRCAPAVHPRCTHCLFEMGVLFLGFDSTCVCRRSEPGRRTVFARLFVQPQLQNGGRVGNVGLPKWASTPAQFIALHRAALESPHVSSNLHRWIDLVFGSAQRGPAAAARDNVFHPLTYEGAVDLDAVSDPTERASLEAQISEFGQTPRQLFTQPHPARRAAGDWRGGPERWRSDTAADSRLCIFTLTRPSLHDELCLHFIHRAFLPFRSVWQGGDSPPHGRKSRSLRR